MFSFLFYPIYKSLFDYLSFAPPATNKKQFNQSEHAAWCLCWSAKRTPHIFKEWEIGPEIKPDKRLSGIDGWGLPLQGVNGLLREALNISALLDVLCSCWTARSEGWQERWDENMLSCELNCGPSSKTWSTWQMYSMCLCEVIHDWPVGLIEICSRGNVLCWQAAATKVRQLMVKWLFQVNFMVSLSLKKTINPSLFTHVFRNHQLSTEAPLWQLWASYDPLCKYNDPKVELCPAPHRKSLIKGLLHQT